MSKQPEKWAVIFQTKDGYHTHNNYQQIMALEGFSMTNAWASPNTPEEVIQLLRIRLTVQNGKLTIL